MSRAWLLAACLLAIAASPAPASAEEAVVAVAAPTSGRQSALGEAVRRGVEQGLAGVADATALLPQGVKVRLIDDHCTSEGGVAAARSLAAPPASVVIGYPCAAAASGALPLHATAGTLLLSLSRHAGPSTPAAGRTIFRVAGRDDRQGVAIAEHIARTIPMGPIALVHDRTQYAVALTRVAAQALSARERTPTMEDGIVAGEKDYPATLARLTSLAPAAVVFAGFPNEAAVLIQKMRAAGLTAPIILAEAAATEELPRQTAGALDGVRVALPWIPHAQATTAGDADAAPLSQVVLTERAARAAATLWLAAVAAAGSAAPDAVARTLSSRRATDAAIGGHFAVNGDRHVPSHAIYSWRDGSWRCWDAP